MSVAQLEVAVAALGDLCGRVVFLGGATIALWMTDPAAPAPRVTYDVDVVAEVATLAEYEEFQVELRRRGFAEDAGGKGSSCWSKLRSSQGRRPAAGAELHKSPQSRVERLLRRLSPGQRPGRAGTLPGEGLVSGGANPVVWSALRRRRTARRGRSRDLRLGAGRGRAAVTDNISDVATIHREYLEASTSTVASSSLPTVTSPEASRRRLGCSWRPSMS